MNQRTLLIGLLVLLVIAGGGYWFYTKIERYTHHWDDGPKLDVLFNPWHAAQTFLQRQQKESHRSFNLHPVFERLNPYDALILDNAAPIANPATRETLKNWMNNGGHLVITAVEEWDFDLETADPLLDDFGVRLYSLVEEEDYEQDYEEVEFDSEEFAEIETPLEQPPLTDTEESEESESVADEEDDAAQSCGFVVYDHLFTVNWNNEKLQIESLGDYSLDDEYGEATRGNDSWPTAVLQYQVGAGKLTVLMDTGIWANGRIGDYDHAYFLWQLVKADDIVWFVSSNASENLMQKLWRTAPYLLIGIIVLLLIWGWRRWVRFGPLIPDHSNEHRQLLEHIEAATRFDWNHHQSDTMLESLRDDIKAEVSRQHNLEFESDQSKWLELVARISQLDAPLIAHAMTQPAPEREHPWTELISQLQTIRNAL